MRKPAFVRDKVAVSGSFTGAATGTALDFVWEPWGFQGAARHFQCAARAAWGAPGHSSNRAWNRSIPESDSPAAPGPSISFEVKRIAPTAASTSVTTTPTATATLMPRATRGPAGLARNAL